MFSITSMQKGKLRRHQVKALELIWGKFSQWDAKNTIHVDDLARNFAMNPQSGLKIKAYRHAHKNRSRDTELIYLAQYLVMISANSNDFSALPHSNWKETLSKQGLDSEAAKLAANNT